MFTKKTVSHNAKMMLCDNFMIWTKIMNLCMNCAILITTKLILYLKTLFYLYKIFKLKLCAVKQRTLKKISQAFINFELDLFWIRNKTILYNFCSCLWFFELQKKQNFIKSHIHGRVDRYKIRIYESCLLTVIYFSLFRDS